MNNSKNTSQLFKQIIWQGHDYSDLESVNMQLSFTFLYFMLRAIFRGFTLTLDLWPLHFSWSSLRRFSALDGVHMLFPRAQWPPSFWIRGSPGLSWTRKIDGAHSRDKFDENSSHWPQGSGSSNRGTLCVVISPVLLGPFTWDPSFLVKAVVYLVGQKTWLYDSMSQ